MVELGATVVLLRPFSPDAEGHRADVVLGHPDLAGYARPTPYSVPFGRYANRMATPGSPSRPHPRATANEEHCLHGGPEGFHARDWTVTEGRRTASGWSWSARTATRGFPAG